MKIPKKLIIKVTIKHDSPCLSYLHVIRMLQSVYRISSHAEVLCKQGIFENCTKFFVNFVQFLKMTCLQNRISSPTEKLFKQGIFKDCMKFTKKHLC